MASRRVSLKGKGADLFFGDYSPEATTTDSPLPAEETHNPSAVDGPTSSAASQPSDAADESKTAIPKAPLRRRSSGRASDQSTNQSIDQSTDRGPVRWRQAPIPGSKIVDRPKGFYITERLDARLDEAVRYYQQVHGLRKVDRSVIVTSILDNDELWSEESLDALLDRIISQLTSRLTNR